VVAQAQPQFSPGGICGRSAPKNGFLLALRLFPVTVILPVFRIYSFIYHSRYVVYNVCSIPDGVIGFFSLT
jgi:hypothetical protein